MSHFRSRAFLQSECLYCWVVEPIRIEGQHCDWHGWRCMINWRVTHTVRYRTVFSLDSEAGVFSDVLYVEVKSH